MVQLVQSVDHLIDNITRFNRDPRGYGDYLWNSPVQVKGWYAIQHPELEDRWIFGPSRIVGYDREELQAYIAGQIGGSVNGGDTEDHLDQWRIQVLPGQPIYDLLAAELSSFLAKFNTRANVSARIYVLHSEWQLQPDADTIKKTEVEKNLRIEGKLLSKTVKFRGRSASMRTLCIEHHEAVCAVCERDFAREFGEGFDGLIDVHHLDPLAQSDETRQTNPETDCRPLCPNCHRMAHYGMPRGTCRPLKELKKIWSSRTE